MTASAVRATGSGGGSVRPRRTNLQVSATPNWVIRLNVNSGAAGELRSAVGTEVIERVALLNVRQDVGDAAVIVSAEGEIDSGTVETLISRLEEALQEAVEHPGRRLVIVLTDVTYFGSAGLNAVLGCHEKGVADGITVRVVANNPEVLMPIEVTKLDSVLKPYESLADALDGPDERS
jgi:anti-anti-sigma factor